MYIWTASWTGSTHTRRSYVSTVKVLRVLSTVFGIAFIWGPDARLQNVLEVPIGVFICYRYARLFVRRGLLHVEICSDRWGLLCRSGPRSIHCECISGRISSSIDISLPVFSGHLRYSFGATPRLQIDGSRPRDGRYKKGALKWKGANLQVYQRFLSFSVANQERHGPFWLYLDCLQGTAEEEAWPLRLQETL